MIALLACNRNRLHVILEPSRCGTLHGRAAATTSGTGTSSSERRVISVTLDPSVYQCYGRCRPENSPSAPVISREHRETWRRSGSDASQRPFDRVDSHSIIHLAKCTARMTERTHER